MPVCSAPEKRKRRPGFGILRAALALVLLATPLGTGLLAQQAQPDPAAVSAPPLPPPTAVLLAARVSTAPERARLVMDLSEQSEFAVVSVDSPNRIAVDVRVARSEVTQPPTAAGDGLIAEWRVEAVDQGRARAVLVLAAPVQVQQAYVLEAFADQPARLVVDLVPDTPEGFAENVAADAAAAAARGNGEVLLSASTPPGASNVVPAPSAEPFVQTRPLIVIDPGHGGADGGAEANNIKESDIVLSFALRMQEMLVATGRFDVALTRDSDTYLTLAERVGVARQNRADLLVSIHADYFQDAEARGASVYTRDENAADILTEVLSEQETRTDLVSSFVEADAQPAVVDLLVDLLRRETRRQSFLAAEAIVNQLEPSVALRRFPVRQGDFFVLQAPDVPSVLVELGFLSNIDDAANLTAGEWRERVAEALARGVANYFDGLTRTADAAP